MNRFAYIFMLAIFLIAIWQEAVPGESAFDPACPTPSSEVEEHMMRFKTASAYWDNDKAKRALANIEPLALTDKSNRGICERLWDGVARMLAIRTQRDGAEYFKYDFGFYRYGEYYAVALVENPIDPNRKDVHPLERVHPGGESSIVLFNSDLQRLGAYDYRGISFDEDPDLVLRQ